MSDIVKTETNKPAMTRIGKAARILSIIAFSLVLAALLSAFIFDIVIFAKQVIVFAFALFAGAAAFVIAIIFMIISLVLIFGIYLLKTEGFWPVQWAKTIYLGIMSENKLSPEQIHQMIVVRIVLVSICVLIFILCIVALALIIKDKKLNKGSKHKLAVAFSIISLILSIFGMLACLGVIAIMSLLA